MFSYSIKVRCPICNQKPTSKNSPKTSVANRQTYGTYQRKSDSRVIQRYKCLMCQKTYSTAINDPAYNHKKRRVNFLLKNLLASCVSLRRAAKLLGISRKTVARKLRFLGQVCREEHLAFLTNQARHIQAIQFDELQSFEHTKCKPLSVAVAVSVHNRKILGFSVSSMPATGHLAAVSRKKYGSRPDYRRAGLRALFTSFAKRIPENVQIHSDQHPFYKPIIQAIFPRANYHQSKGVKAAVTGQGELKKKQNDPLFCINHTLAMLRANINRLVRKTWCTTKDPARLADHLAIYISVHNSVLTT